MMPFVPICHICIYLSRCSCSGWREWFRLFRHQSAPRIPQKIPLGKKSHTETSPKGVVEAGSLDVSENTSAETIRRCAFETSWGRFHQRTWALLRVKLRLSWRFVRICFFLYTTKYTLLFFVFLFFLFLRSPSNGLVDTFNPFNPWMQQKRLNVCSVSVFMFVRYRAYMTWIGVILVAFNEH